MTREKGGVLSFGGAYQGLESRYLDAFQIPNSLPCALVGPHGVGGCHEDGWQAGEACSGFTLLHCFTLV